MRVGVGVRGDDDVNGVAVIRRGRYPPDHRGQAHGVRVGAMIGRRSVAMFTLLRQRMSSGFGMRMPVSGHRHGAVVRLDSVGNCTM